VDDIEAEWTFHNPFDLVHVRFMAASIMDWPKACRAMLHVSLVPFALSSYSCVPFHINHLIRHTKPGGWVEFKDWDLSIVSSDNSFPKDSYIYEYHHLLYNALNKIGRTYAPGPNLKKWAEEAGYINVTTQVLPVPIGLWPKEKRLVGCFHLFFHCHRHFIS
jgi:hypothetical protein